MQKDTHFPTKDAADWQSFAANIKPLLKKKVKAEVPVVKRPVTKESPLIFPIKPLPPLSKKASVKTKKNEVDATLDLHGKTLAQGFNVFSRFIIKATQMGNRHLLIITGKGKPDTHNTLRAALPEWINHPDLRPYIGSYTEAPQNLGGAGAYVLMLKKHPV